MKLLVYSKTTKETIGGELGFPEYSYYFALKEFLPVLRDLGEVVTIKNPELEVDKIFFECQHQQEECFFFSFTPPHKTPLNFRCPTIPVFAWEFSTIPDEEWNDDPNNNWCSVLTKLGIAITHSHYAARAVKAAVGSDFPVLSIPCPVWDKYGDYRARKRKKYSSYTVGLHEDDGVVDSNTIDLESLDPLDISPPNSVDYYDYAVDLITKRDTQLLELNLLFEKRNTDCLYAESIVRERDEQLKLLLSTRLGRLNARLIERRKRKSGSDF